VDRARFRAIARSRPVSGWRASGHGCWLTSSFDGVISTTKVRTHSRVVGSRQFSHSAISDRGGPRLAHRQDDARSHSLRLGRRNLRWCRLGQTHHRALGAGASA
jgi:hypothetical protein